MLRDRYGVSRWLHRRRLQRRLLICAALLLTVGAWGLARAAAQDAGQLNTVHVPPPAREPEEKPSGPRVL